MRVVAGRLSDHFAQVTQRPGGSSLATSVNTLTTGSQATVTLRSPDFSSVGTEEWPWVAWATGMRTRTDISACPFSRSEIVRVRMSGRATPAARSTLAARLTAVAGVPCGSCTPPERSRPNASGTALSVSETAIAAKTPRDSCGMVVDPSPDGDQRHNAREPAGFSGRLSLNRVQKYLEGAGTSPGVWESSRQPVIPPAPLTGDVGRGCGDASRALLFCPKCKVRAARPTRSRDAKVPARC